jgi:hypothetical protein
MFDATDHGIQILISSSWGTMDGVTPTVNNLILGYLLAFAISIDALNIAFTGNSIFDCPEQSQTSPNKTSFSVMVSNVPFANG